MSSICFCPGPARWHELQIHSIQQPAYLTVSHTPYRRSEVEAVWVCGCWSPAPVANIWLPQLPFVCQIFIRHVRTTAYWSRGVAAAVAHKSISSESNAPRLSNGGWLDIKYEMSHWRRRGPAQHQIGGVVAISPIGALRRRFRLKPESHRRSRLQCHLQATTVGRHRKMQPWPRGPSHAHWSPIYKVAHGLGKLGSAGA